MSVDIIDQGPGIPEAEQTKLFKAFPGVSRVWRSPATALDFPLPRAAQAMANELRLAASGPKGSRFRLEITYPVRAPQS